MTRWHDPAPGEREAADRSWGVVRSAFEERIRFPRTRDWRPLIAIAFGVAVLAAAFSPPGNAVLGSLRDAVRGRDHLVSLPSRGSILVNAQGGAWIVKQDGSKRFLGGYDNAVWSPHGLYLAAARGNELIALEPNGRVHWKLARDGTGDRLVTPNAGGTGLAALAWRPGTHELAFNNSRNQLVLLDVDRRRVLWRRPAAGLEQLLWSDDGRRLLVADGRPRILDATGRTVAALPKRNLLPAAFLRRSHSVALANNVDGNSTVTIYSGPRYERRRIVFSGAGLFAGLAWSPDGRWLLVDWRSADQWVFIRSTAVRRIEVRNIGNTFDSGPEHYATLGGWCCP
jgi:hypothetical protein